MTPRELIGLILRRLEETVSGHVPFSRQWLDRYGLVPDRCTVIGVQGESMEPTLPEGSSILVDRSPSRPKDGRRKNGSGQASS